jgi:hypothetical protein
MTTPPGDSDRIGEKSVSKARFYHLPDKEVNRPESSARRLGDFMMKFFAAAYIFLSINEVFYALKTAQSIQVSVFLGWTAGLHLRGYVEKCFFSLL